MASFEHINIKATNIELTPELRALAEEKIHGLEKFVPKDESALGCDIELEKTTDHHQTGKIYRAEINMRVGALFLRAEATEERIEDALYEARNEMKAELRHKTNKQRSLMRRGGQRIKDMMRFGR